MPIEIKEIVVRTTISEGNQKEGVHPELIRKLKRDIMKEVFFYIEQKEKRKRER